MGSAIIRRRHWCGAKPVATIRSGVCACGAWLGSLGLEPSPELYIEHIVECFRHVRRVLRDDGCMFVNLGDSYAGSGKGPTGHNGIGNQVLRQGFESASVQGGWLANRAISGNQGRVVAAPGYKAKDLMLMPFRVAMALQVDGWWLRSVIPWLKRNAMPESVTDRPATAVEYVFLLSKSARYFWDADAVRVPQGNNTHSRGNGHTPKEVPMGQGIKANSSFHAATNGVVVPGGRSRRNSDWFFESWQGLLLDEQDDPLALMVNLAPFSGAHFATFPVKLVEPMVLASTRPNDTVLDPFSGAGTVGLVADRLGRNAVLCELSAKYTDLSIGRVTGDAPMFTELVTD
jgi:DNA modification methylase